MNSSSIAGMKSALFLCSALPFAWLVYGAIADKLGTNPVETLTHETGEWCLRFLLITLSITPLRRITGAGWLLRFRRMFGLYAFFYACMHFMTYVWFDHYFDIAEIITDIPKRPFITVGFIAFLMMLPLAITSTNSMMKRLGRRWKSLHKLAYIIPMFGLLHFLWVVKADAFEPMIYMFILLTLLAFRAWIDRHDNR